MREAVDDIRGLSIHDQRSIWAILRRKAGIRGAQTSMPEQLGAKDFATYMRELYSLDESLSAAQHAPINETSTSAALNYKNSLNHPHPLPKPIEADEGFFKAALSLKIGKSPGVDGISGDLISLSETSQKWIYEICSRCSDAEKQPSEWLKSKVTRIKAPQTSARDRII
ncbi:hypothetical protein FOL46_000879 [Perkinsus olseni]|nr:hypothetical protein FOL46_000879 [Perkinsus olseni]